ncbi:hypothetical protein [Wolbachia endosymbiont (group B) of Xanthorhoe designata]|uniref:hypothetical protein n=1 Tax=Wolbachia endosymbiont (group B) of Xanthorhoe designata TaxID=3066184 RepID=UPI00333E1AAD
MSQFKDTPSVEKKFKDVFKRSPGAFPEGSSLEEKVDRIAKGTKALKAIKDNELEGRMKNVAELNKELQRRQRQENEEIRKLTRSTQELRKEFGINKSSRPDSNDKSLQETKQISKQKDIGVRASMTTKSSEELKQPDNNDKPLREINQISKQKGMGVQNSKSSKELKQDDTPQPQENQKEEGLLSLLGRFLKKILEKLFGGDEKNVENARDTKEAAQKSISNNGIQQHSMSQSSFININGKEFNLEPGKAFNYQDKALNIKITYNSSEQDTTFPNVTNVINLNIDGKEHNVQPDESFNYKGPGLEISVMNGNQQSKNFDKILSQDQSISEGLKQATKLDDPSVTPVNTPEVEKTNTGRGR